MDSLNITLSVLINYTLQALSSHLFVEIIIMIIPVMYRSLSLLSVHFTEYRPNPTYVIVSLFPHHAERNKVVIKIMF